MGRRVAAALVAVAMIGTALWWRQRDEAAEATSSQTKPTANDVSSVVCPPDLMNVCVAAGNATGIDIEAQNVDDTLAASAPPSAWVAISPLPAAAAFGTSTEMNETPLASSPLTLVVLSDRSDALTATCGATVDWECLGRNAGTAWSELGGDASWGTFRPGLSSTSTAIGAVSASAAVMSYFDGRSIDTADPGFISWARQFARTVPTSTLSAGTAVGTIQVRSSTLDIAAGTAAELAATNADRFDTVPVGDNIDVTIVLATTDGTRVPDAFVEALRDELTNTGWAAAVDTPVPFTGGDVRAAVTAWKDMQ